jgi:hypothetical protein
MGVHAEREHATWSASSTERNWNCPGALALTKDLPDTSNEAADWGTACHQVAEKCLRQGKDPNDFLGTTEKGKKHSFEVDEEMAETAAVYVDYVRQRMAEYEAETGQSALLFIEERFSLASLNPPFDAGGTSDAVLIFPAWEMIEAVDLKGGRGVVVEAKGNPQARTYALGAMLQHQGVRIRQVRSTIVQPRAGHKDGRIRSETIHAGDLLEWTSDLLEAMRHSYDAFAAAADSPSPGTDPAWAAAFLKAGDHCKFCKAAGFCPALEQKALDAAGVWFDDLDQPRLSNAPDTLSPERAAQLLDAADMIGDWINAVRAYWHGQAEGGVTIPGYILVAKEGREKWLDDEASARAAALAKQAGVPEEKVFNAPKIRTPKQVRDAVKKAKGDLSLFAGLSSADVTGTNLVREDKTTRPAATPSVHQHLEDLDAPKPNLFD